MSQPAFRDMRRTVRLSVHGEIDGRLLTFDQPLHLRDLGSGGFLADTPVRVSLGSMHQVRLSSTDGEETIVIDVRCAHCRRRTELQGGPLFAVGFAFVAPNDPAIAPAVDRLLDRLTGSLSFT